jgi:hypothetical protein
MPILVTGAATAAQTPTRFRDRNECRFACEFLPKNKLSIAQNYASNELCRIGISAQDMGYPSPRSIGIIVLAEIFLQNIYFK